MVGDLGESLWLKEIFSSVYGEKRPLCHIGMEVYTLQTYKCILQAL